MEKSFHGRIKRKEISNMSNEVKALVIGDYSKAQYHPLTDVDKELMDIFKDKIQVQCTDDYERFQFESLKDFDLCISYTDCWGEKITQQQVGGILSFVANGGGLLVIHNGISLQSNYEFAQLVGAKFTGHPAYTKLEMEDSKSQHVIMEGIENFDVEDEPYRYDFNSFSEKTILAEYKYEGVVYPAAWAIEYGLGRVVYLMPGHDTASFISEMYRKLILRSGMWAVKLL
jgi:uncharacterized protein